MKGVAQKISLQCPPQFYNTNSRFTINFEATDFSFWLKVNWIWAFKCCFMTLSLRSTIFAVLSKMRFIPHRVLPIRYKNNFRKLFLYLMGRTQWGINHVFDDTAKTVDLRLKVIKQHLKAHIQLTLSQKEKSVASKLIAWRLFVS